MRLNRKRRKPKLKTGKSFKKVTPEQRAQYHKYLNSAQWKEKRKFALEFYGNRCGLCGSKYDLEIHHRSYKNIFRELMEDLMILCETCHKRHHRNEVLKNGKKSRYMKDPNYDTTPTTYYPKRSINELH